MPKFCVLYTNVQRRLLIFYFDLEFDNIVQVHIQWGGGGGGVSLGYTDNGVDELFSH